MRTVKEISDLTGISVRTLHYYDEIGLLKPTEKSDAGYRLYDDRALEILQQILFFREFDIPLKEIKAVLENPALERNQILQMQRKMLVAKKERMERLITSIDDILKGENKMDFAIFSKTEVEEMFQTMFEHMPDNMKELAVKEFGSIEEWKKHYIKTVSSEEMQKGYAKVVVLGDFSWGNASQTTEILDELKGKIYLIRGNHDRFLDDKNFDASRFVWIKDYAELNENKRKVVLSHYPIACYNGQYRRDEDGNPKTFMLHGHIHATQDQQFLDAYQEYIHQQKHPRISDGQLEGVPCQLINCFCMYSDYVPMTLDEWIEIDKRRRNIL